MQPDTPFERKEPGEASSLADSVVCPSTAGERVDANSTRSPEPDFASVVEKLSDAMIVADEENVIVYTNEALTDLLGWKPDEVIGRRVADTVVPRRFKTQHAEGFKRYVETSRPTIMGRPIQLTGRTPDDKEVEIELVLSPGRAADGSPLIVGTLRDASEMVGLERNSALVRELLEVLAHPDSIEETTTRILRGICVSLDWDAGAIWMIDRPANALRCLQFWTSPSVSVPDFEMLSRMTLLRKGVGLPGRVWELGKGAWIEDVTTEVNFPRRSVALREGLRSGFALPISKDGEIVGVAEFFSRQVLPPQQALIDTMSGISDELGDFLSDRASTEELGFQKALLESQSEASVDGILVVSPRGEMMYWNERFIELWGLPQEVMESRSDDLAQKAVLENLVDPQQFLERITYLYDHPHETSRDELELKDGRIFERHSAPVRGKDGTHYGRAWYVRDITEHKRAEAQLDAAYHAEAAARADAEKARGELAFLLEASSALSASLDFVQGLAGLARLAVPKLADICLVHLVDQEGIARRVALVLRDLGKEPAADLLLPATTAGEANTIARVLKQGKPELSSNGTRFAGPGTDENSLRAAAELECGSYLCFPINARGSVLGTLTLVNSESGRIYREADLALGEELGSRAAIAIENARLFQERSNIAHVLQQSLLPPELPQIPGIELAALYRPGKEGSEVGGDFYDAFPVKGNEWALVIGDVCGKGAAAATLTALARHTLQAAAALDADPKQVLSLVNEAFLREGSGRFCTLSYTGLHLVEGRQIATVSTAGHPPPLVLHPGGEVDTVTSEGDLLGVLDDPELLPTSIMLEPDDTIIFYTDGLADLIDRRLPAGSTLQNIFAGLDGKTPGEIVAALEDLVDAERKSGYPDDIAVLVARILPDRGTVRI